MRQPDEKPIPDLPVYGVSKTFGYIYKVKDKLLVSLLDIDIERFNRESE